MSTNLGRKFVATLLHNHLPEYAQPWIRAWRAEIDWDGLAKVSDRMSTGERCLLTLAAHLDGYWPRCDVDRTPCVDLLEAVDRDVRLAVLACLDAVLACAELVQ